MDFLRLHQLGPDALASNATTTSLPSSFLETFVPGYGIVSQIILRLFGIDIGVVASGFVILFGLSHATFFCAARFSSYFDRYFTSAVTIDGDDQLYRDVVKWATEQPMTRISRDLRAETKLRGVQYDPEDDSDSDDDKPTRPTIFNHGKLANNVPPRYEPNYGIDKFVHGGRTYYLSRERKDKKAPWWGDAWDEAMIVRCTGRSTQPIKSFLLHVKQWNLKNEHQTTNIHRPSPKGENNGDTRWKRQSNRASRPMRTVSLETEQKRIIVNDVNEYLQPETRRWYNARGIPYRRGYLFHGPPGTGKTSLSFALAGIFGLDIYCISLSEVGLTEADLNKLFTELPRRCIVLLEDIDSAGLRRDNEPAPEPAPEPASPTISETKASTQSEPLGPRKSLISLAGLLNVIDGVASHEGRVLIMTTNHPENLDEALTRPGRVDIRIPFTLATRTQIEDIFIRMYGTEMRKSLSRSRTSDANQKRPQKPMRRGTQRRRTKSIAEDVKDEDEDEDDIKDLLYEKPVSQIPDKAALRQMAVDYAEILPEGMFSPAAIQGYLLTRKREPRRALDEACAWRDEQLKAMEEKKR